ncbi:putative mitochondrial chaperone BCS1-A OS=Dictyostelium discoideum GN=bcs1la PE=3 SV=1 [Rhizoctonia solani AG-1 IB]|uniref:Putative mitochondrial chaperone BCS1-A n=1 Tax=Thanatephorus cucumeris (strain AG1-IB / isolate 7/3/14) TaxID=1108050 RepID=A0A0B7FSE9_THACB|nr:putative mitochondrial chaperone BCS1-A OS=Dictyostelium discoideum GN=bcs1la PE=3 SV=1 [Rhizoctonia solani AG-1 IB]
MRVKRSRRPTDDRLIRQTTITLFTFSRVALQELIETAAREYRARDLAEIQIHIGDQYGGWRYLSSKAHRNFESVVLQQEVKRQLLNDTTEFLENERWYADRGVPYRRGYLLYGTPGSGKSSSIHALASELRLDVYIIPLSLKVFNDTTLADLVSNTPERCILLYEDIDAAFPNRSSNYTARSGVDSRKDPGNSSGITLSGLLNTIDGVQAPEGRLLFATTNRPELLDPAVSRPGRMDIKIEYRHATRWQAKELFRLFYRPDPGAKREAVDEYADAFADSTPPGQFSIAQLQGYLIQHKGYPERAVKEVSVWVDEALPGQFR